MIGLDKVQFALVVYVKLTKKGPRRHNKEHLFQAGSWETLDGFFGSGTINTTNSLPALVPTCKGIQLQIDQFTLIKNWLPALVPDRWVLKRDS